MYSQGNYNHQFGQGPYQQRPPGLPPPPPPPPHFQQVPPAAPPHIGQPAPPIYQHGHPPPPPTVRQVAHGGTANASTSYLHPPPPVHGNTSLPHMYPTAQQNSQYPSHLGTHNVHHIPQSVPPPPPPSSLGTPRPDMLQAPPPSRVLPPPPPPPSQGQILYRASVLPPPQQPGGVQGLQHIPPPPPTSSFLTSPQYGSFVQSTSGNSHFPPLAPPPPPPTPPPPPSSPPPVPPSPPPTSSTPLLNASYMSGRANSDTNSNRVSGSKLRTSDCVDKAVALTQDGHKVSDGCLNFRGGSNYEVGSLGGDGSPSKESVMLDLPPPPPPPKPTEEKVVQKIEGFCMLIAKNGPGYEDMVRHNENGNPEFEFLFGGKPGSDTAIAHEYFLWMKKRSILACKLDGGTSDSPLRPLGIESSKQPDHKMAAGGSNSPVDSDMEMEGQSN